MTLIKRINTITKPFINNSIFRYSHHYEHRYQEAFYLPQPIVINLLGEQKSVDTASWEIKGFAKEKSLQTANIVYDMEILRSFLLGNNILQFIVNRCYNMSYQNLLYLNNDIINTNKAWKPYNLYVLSEAKNRFTTSKYIQNYNRSNIIVYPLASTEENKRRDINILIDS
jgi:hypothetical protein